jgi:formate C-acetyltransferase
MVPQPFASLVTKGCVDKGADFTRGGPIFNYTGPQGVGLADVADSMAAVKKLVFEEEKVTMSDLLQALDTNFEQAEALRQMLLAAPKYGNDDDYADDLAKYVARVYCVEVSKYRNTRGGHYRPGLYAVSSNVPLGLNVGALPSGRKSGEPLADGGLSVKHGMDRNGPTAAVKSVAKVDHTSCRNGTLLNQKFHPSALDTRERREKLASLIRTYFALGGMHIQFNCIDADTLRDAKKHPEKHRSLVVRVAGYSAYFVDLDPGVQDDIIARTEFRTL